MGIVPVVLDIIRLSSNNSPGLQWANTKLYKETAMWKPAIKSSKLSKLPQLPQRPHRERQPQDPDTGTWTGTGTYFLALFLLLPSWARDPLFTTAVPVPVRTFRLWRPRRRRGRG